MLITNPNAVKQALANVRLESLSIPSELQALLDKALKGDPIDTSPILDLLRG